MSAVTLHLRSETKPLEHRSALTPTTTRKLIDSGFKINVEKSPERIFDDKEFEAAGATLVEEGSWPNAPKDHIIIGLKELEDKDPFPLKHTHIQFAHCYKNQGGWKEVLNRFPRGGGTLYDLEFLTDDNGRRVAAFGYHAGYAGAALALMDWAWQLQYGAKVSLPGKTHYTHKDELDKEVNTAVKAGASLAGDKMPRVLVIGALGRCGRGALDMCRQAGIPEEHLLKWDMAETKRGGPFEEIRSSDIFINCIYLGTPIPPFVTLPFLQAGSDNASSKRNLSVVCDVSCDTTNPHNPIPFCNKATSFSHPTVTLPLKELSDPPLSYITIDHLPSLLPREASEAFSEALLPSLLDLPRRKEGSRVWQEAERLFDEKVKAMSA